MKSYFLVLSARFYLLPQMDGLRGLALASVLRYPSSSSPISAVLLLLHQAPQAPEGGAHHATHAGLHADVQGYL